jgi:hypothetical protein
LLEIVVVEEMEIAAMPFLMRFLMLWWRLAAPASSSSSLMQASWC